MGGSEQQLRSQQKWLVALETGAGAEKSTSEGIGWRQGGSRDTSYAGRGLVRR